MKVFPFILSILPASLKFLVQKEEAASPVRCITYIAAILLLGCSYVFACIGLYQYYKDLWGEMESFFLLGAIFFLTSFALLIVGWVLKPKKIPPALSNSTSLLENVLNQQSTIADSLSKKLSNSSPITPLAVLAAVAIATYLTTPKKET